MTSRSLSMLAGLFLLFAARIAAQTPPGCTGDVLVSWRGVSAYSNAPFQGKLDTCGPRGPYGWQYTCVEYVRRFYNQVFQVDTGTSWWTTKDAKCFFPPGTEQELIGYANGATTVPPAPDDILVFDQGGNDSAGHIAIVTSVVGSQVFLAEENYRTTYPAAVVLSQDGGTGFWSIAPRGALPVKGWMRVKQAVPGPTLLRQLSYTGVAIPAGGTTSAQTVAFQALVSDPSGELVRLDVEVQPSAIPFTNSPTYSTGLVAAGTLATRCVLGIADGDYHWQARTTSASQKASPWVPFDPNPAGGTDFGVQATVCAPCSAALDSSAAVTPLAGGTCGAALAVTLSASPSNGPAPLDGVGLTALVSGLSAGTINYTFYCDRPDAGTDITPGYSAKIDSTSTNPMNQPGICNYAVPGVHMAKVIAENGAGAAEARIPIVVEEPAGSTAPAVSTLGSSAVTATGAVASLAVDPNGIDTVAWFDWGTSTSFCCSTAPVDMGAGTLSLTAGLPITGLMCGTTYFFRAHAQNGVGDDVTGATLSFTTGGCGGSGVLTVALAGTGTGSVLSSPSGIACPGACGATYPSGTQVVLSPNPSPGSTFAGWSGDPACATGFLAMNGNHACTATFSAAAAAFTLTVGENGSGTVASSDGGIACGGSCSHTYVANTTVTLAATAASGWSFSGWSGNCSGGPVVQLTMNANLGCTAIFSPNPQSSPVTTTGAATSVTSSSAILNGTINPENLAATAYFQYGPDPNLGSATPGVPFGAGNNTFSLFAQPVTGLACATTYRFRAVGVSAGGDFIAANNTFTTAACPMAPCYPLNVIANGDAPAPVPSPSNAAGCPFGQFHAGDHVALTVLPIAGDVVLGWSGTDDDASTAFSNTVTMNQPINRDVFAIYQHICYHLSLGATGQGTTPAATNPVASCPAGTFPWGYEVDLSGASPAANWQIGGWSGTENDAAVIGSNNVLMPPQDDTVLVNYVPIPYLLTVTKIGNGSGTAISDVPGIDCGATCGALYPNGTIVTLTGTPDPGSVFLGWSGGTCNGGRPTMTQTITCTGVFGLASPTPAKFYTLTPCRVFDSRNAGDGPAIPQNAARTLVFAGKCGIPSTAIAVSVNLTIVNPTADGYLSLYPAVGVPPSISSINFRQGQVLANNAVADLNQGAMTLFCAMSAAGSVDYVVDVNGYFQ